eukprot:TRINITY_DN4684_c0_g1_i5.p1 TRINITY_DN4684_c0_g1~~TRINITY_DN4684_c0_g1_i5.p1  ORF type:complete len:333 (-),score=124.62 TRINITY_DN4684_c0_g1_i5:40-1038(-)
MFTKANLFTLVLVPIVSTLPPNYEDVESAVDQAVGEMVDINQADPQSNTIHIAHNNPKDSDIKVVQSNPFNTTIHISLNVGSGSKAVVMMTNARNIQLHISFNGMSKSECEVEIVKAFNSSVHLSFQNPRNTPVKVTMDETEISSLHVSQNIPQNSPMEVSMSAAKNNQIHLTQAVPMNSPLTWKLDGDVESNQILVSQNAADDNSPLDCTPECPQEEYVYDYQYADAGHDATNQIEEVQDISTNQIEEEELPSRQETVPVEENYDYTDYQQEWEQSVVEEQDVVQQQEQDEVGQLEQCPGGDLEACVDVCPGEFGAKVFGFCVGSCGRRCP